MQITHEHRCVCVIYDRLTLAPTERAQEGHPFADHIVIDVLEYLGGVLDATRRPLARTPGAGQQRSDGGRRRTGAHLAVADVAADAAGRQTGREIIAETEAFRAAGFL